MEAPAARARTPVRAAPLHEVPAVPEEHRGWGCPDTDARAPPTGRRKPARGDRQQWGCSGLGTEVTSAGGVKARAVVLT